jgi:hypothetical protein
VRQLLANTPIRIVATLHSTSVVMTERTYAKAELAYFGLGGKAYNRKMPTDLPTNPDLSSEVAALKRQVAQLLRLLGQVDVGGRALSISQFCARNNISRSFFYKLKKRRKAPRIMDVDGRQIISPEAERDWRLERERENASTGAAQL